MRFRVRQKSFVRACSWGSSPNRLDCESLRNPSRRSIIAHLSFFENKNVSAPEERVIFEQGTISTSVTHTFRGGINHEKIFFDDRCRGTRSCLSAQEQGLPHKIDVAAAIDGQTRREVIFAARSARPPYGPHPSGGRTQESLLREAFFAWKVLRKGRCAEPWRRIASFSIGRAGRFMRARMLSAPYPSISDPSVSHPARPPLPARARSAVYRLPSAVYPLPSAVCLLTNPPIAICRYFAFFAN